MAKDKLIPTWVKVAAVAALFVPFSVKVERDENEKIKKVSTRSIAAGVTYVSGDEGKESDLSLTFPGIVNPEKTTKAFSVDGDAIAKGAANLSDKVSLYAKKAAAGAKAFYEKFTEEEVTDTEEGVTDAEDFGFIEEDELDSLFDEELTEL